VRLLFYTNHRWVCGECIAAWAGPSGFEAHIVVGRGYLIWTDVYSCDLCPWKQLFELNGRLRNIYDILDRHVDT